MDIKDQYTILAIDDAKDSLMLLEFDLAEFGFQVITAESGEAALTLLKDISADLILLDMHMPGMSGLTTLKSLKCEHEFQNIPVIMLSASGDENAIVSALELGADDYVTKPYIPKVLLARINNSLRFMEKAKQLELLAKTDSLTKLNNRGSYKDLTCAAIGQAKRNGQFVSVAMFDLDYFKQVNDSYGHEAGDIALKEFSMLLKECFRDYDVIGRVGGEEFAVSMPNTIIDDAFLACERCRNALETHVMKLTKENNQIVEFNVTVSIGITACQGETMDYDDMMRHADHALYKAKESGRNQSLLDEELTSMNKNVELNANQLLSSMTSNSEDKEEMKNEFPGIDYTVGINNVLGDDALFKEILLMFYQDHGQDKDKIIKAIVEHDHAAVKSLVHTLKGVACSIGAMTLFEHCKVLDVAINEQNEQQYEQLFMPIAKELDLVIDGLQQTLADRI